MVAPAKKEIGLYDSKEAQYNLDPNRLFEVFSDLHNYAISAPNIARIQNKKKNPQDNEPFMPSATLYPNGKRLILNTEVVNEKHFFERFDLAELVLSENNEELLFSIHAHPKVTIDPTNLYTIGERYKVE